MAIQSNATLKSYFETGDVPTQVQFGDLIDSFVHVNSQWSLPAESLDILGIASISGNAGYAEHGPFRFWIELHANTEPGASGYDYVFALGMNGDGATTNISLITWETSFDTGGGWKTDEFYYTKRHPGGVPLWPTPRRIGWCFATFSTNRGNVANGTAIGLANCDNVEFHATQPSAGGSKAGWNYANITNNFSTGTTSFGIQSHSTNYGQYLVTCSSDGVAENITGSLSVAVSGDSINLNWAGGSLAINGTTKTAAFATTTLQASTPADNGATPAGQFFNSNPNLFNYNTVDCRTLSANQMATIGFWNQNTNRWRVGNNGAAGVNRFVIVNDALGTEALGIDIADNTLRFGSFTSGSDVASNGYVIIKTADGTTRKLMTTA